MKLRKRISLLLAGLVSMLVVSDAIVGQAPDPLRPALSDLVPGQAQDTVRFAMIGDFGDDGPAETGVAALVASWSVDFVTTVGDNNYPDGAASTIDSNIGKHYQRFIKPYTGSHGLGSSDVNRFFPALGNHDWRSIGCLGGNCAGPYFDYFDLPGNERYYDVVWGPVHLFFVDSDPNEPDGTSSSGTQAQWLRAGLLASSSPWQMVFFHHAAYSSSSNHGSNAGMQWPFAAWGADAVFGGHDHTYERLLVDGLLYFVNGLGGRSLYGFGPALPQTQARYNADYGAMLIEAEVDGVRFAFHSRDGSLIDSVLLDEPLLPSATASPLPPSATPQPTPATLCLGDRVVFDRDNDGRFEPGEYLAAVELASFGPAGSLDGFESSTGNDRGGLPPDPDDNQDGDDNGGNLPDGRVASFAITLEAGGEPEAEVDGDDRHSNASLDFGFLRREAPTAVGLAGLHWSRGAAELELRWQTLAEPDLIGFHVYSDGRWKAGLRAAEREADRRPGQRAWRSAVSLRRYARPGSLALSTGGPGRRREPFLVRDRQDRCQAAGAGIQGPPALAGPEEDRRPGRRLARASQWASDRTFPYATAGCSHAFLGALRACSLKLIRLRPVRERASCVVEARRSTRLRLRFAALPARPRPRARFESALRNRLLAAAATTSPVWRRIRTTTSTATTTVRATSSAASARRRSRSAAATSRTATATRRSTLASSARKNPRAWC